MGAQANCRLHVGAQVHEGVALLETDELLFRGPIRVKIPLKSISDVSADAGRLVVRHANEDAVFELGDVAPRWAEKIRSPKSLIDKLDVKVGDRVSVIGVGDEDFVRQLSQRVSDIATGRLAKGSNLVFLGAETTKDLERLARAKVAIVPDGAIWVVHPKGKGALKDTEIFTEGKRAGLTATKVARFSETHTAEKLVIPAADRAKAGREKAKPQSSRPRR